MKYIFLFLTVFFSAYLNAQITLINTGTTDNLFISVIDKKIVLSGHTFIKRSNDDCSTFIQLTIPEPGSFNTLTRIDTSICYMLSSSSLSSNRIYKSTNGGLTWTQKYGGNTKAIDYILFFNGNEGIAPFNNYQVMTTIDGFSTWTVTSHPVVSITSAKSFGDSLVCLGGGDGSITLSKNRGATWPYGWGLSGDQAADIFFLNKDTIFAMSLNGSFGNTFVRTFNEGVTWQSKPLPLYFASHIHFKKANEGYVLGQDLAGNGIILKTLDLGQSWATFNTNLNSLLFDMEFLNDSVALVSGTNSILFKWNTKQTQFVGVKENLINNTYIKVYPNPVNDILHIELTDAKENDRVKIEIINNIGQLIEEEEITFKNNQATLNTSNLQSGVYYLNLNGIRKRFVIVR